MIGVVIGRFQVPSLHEGHIALLSAVAAKSTRLLVLVGVSPAPFNAHDPLPFFCRADAIRSVFPAATVLPLGDCRDDKEWTAQIDALLAPLKDTCVIYGGRSNSLGHYTGRWPVQSLDLAETISGAQVREATDLGFSFEFRTGMVYAAQMRFPTSYQAVDIAITWADKLLLGRKPGEHEKWRFPGGFVDPTDQSLEMAAHRELIEECGHISIGGAGALVYVGSVRIQDWRYRASVDQVMTAVFLGKYQYGAIQASDDMGCLWWAPRHKLLDDIHPVHRPIAELLIAHWNKTTPVSLETP